MSRTATVAPAYQRHSCFPSSSSDGQFLRPIAARIPSPRGSSTACHLLGRHGMTERSSTVRRGAPYVLTLLLAASASIASAQNAPTGGQQPAVNTGSSAVEGFFPEPRLLQRAIQFAEKRAGNGGEAKRGFYPEFANMPTGAGWITVGPGYRYWFFDNQLLVDGSAAISWRSYKMAQARVELPRLAGERLVIGSQVRWQDLTQITYYGTGPETLESQRSEYRLKSTNVLGYAEVKPIEWLSIGGRAGWIGRPSVLPPSGSFKRGHPPTEVMFPQDPVFALAEQPRYRYGEASVAVDTRDHRGYPRRGAIYRAGWSAYSDRDTGTFGFTRTELEGAHFVPVGTRVVVAARGWLVTSHTAEGKLIPFYLEPSLGGNNTIRAYNDYRFHDRNLLVFNLESRFPVFTHMDVALFADAGNVAARLSDLDLNRHGVGAGVRVHTSATTLVRFDVAYGDDGWMLFFRMNDVLRLSRLSRRTAAIPFAP
jgi:Omp85 superfamily domain